MKVVVGSRGSELALWQSHYVAERLREAHGSDFEVEIKVFSTRGDRQLDKPLPEIGGKGLFTAELEEALLAGEVDIAVHSLKDLPTSLPEGLAVLSVPRRADPRDALLLPSDVEGGAAAAGDASPFASLSTGAVVGTSSLRRAAQLRRLRPDVEIRDIRGNVPTRIRKMDEGSYDAILLACAGLDRLELSDRIHRRLDSPWIGAAGQGVLGIEGRLEDPETEALLAPLQDHGTHLEVVAERTVLAGLEGGCSIPLGVRAVHSGSMLQVEAVVLSLDGTREARVQADGAAQLDQAASLGLEVVRQLVDAGAREILVGGSE